MALNQRHNICRATDEYKPSQVELDPKDIEFIMEYTMARGGEFDEIQFYGLQYYLIEYLEGVVVTQEKIDIAAKRFKANFGFDYFPREKWEYILKEHGGKLPISIRAVPEGMVIPNRNVLFAVVNTDPNCAWLVPYIESLLLKVFAPCNMATLGRAIQMMFKEKAKITGEEVPLCMDNDFGYRGCRTEEESVICGSAHLINSPGSDTCKGEDGAIEYYDAPEGTLLSVRASEHHDAQTWGEDKELEFLEHVIDVSPPEAILSNITDTWDTNRCQEIIIGEKLRNKILARPGKFVLRPDSGEPAETCIRTIKQINKAFGGTSNDKGFIINNPKVGVLMGEHMSFKMEEKVIDAAIAAGFGFTNFCFGMGGQRYATTRDTNGFTTKECAFCQNGVWKSTSKHPLESEFKKSQGGRLKLIKENGKYKTVDISEPGEDLLVEVFRDGKILKKYTFAEVKANGALS